MITLKGAGSEGSGPGLVRISGSFALSGTTITATRPSKGNFTVTRRGTGVYVVAYQQQGLSVVSAGAQLGDATGQSGQVFRTGVGAYTWMSQDFMTVNAAVTQYLTDPTKKLMLILVFNSGNNALVDIPANTRCSFDYCIATSTMNQ